MSLILGILDSGGAAVPAGGLAYDSIATVTVGATSVADITFSSIPATYTHLQIRGIGRNTAGSRALLMQFNSDTGSNYSRHHLSGDGSSAGTDATASTTALFGGLISRSTYTAGIFGASVMDVLDYKDTNKYKTLRYLAGGQDGSEGLIFFGSGLWQNTNAITSIKIFADSAGNLPQYSQYALYGIKGA